MTRPKKAMSARVAWASVAVANARADPDIANRLAKYGIDAARLDQDNTLLIGASASMSNQVAATGQHLAASAHTDAIEGIVRTQTDAIANIAKVALDRPSLATLGLDRMLPRALDTFVTASLAIYDNAAGQPAIAAQLAKYGYPADRLAQERNQVQAFIDARRAQEAAKGAAQQATAAQDKAMTALDEEMRAFKKIAKVALKDAPQLLEKLGIPVRTTRTEAQRHAGAKAAATRKAKKQPKPEERELVGVK